MERLFRILALRELGFPLAEIGGLLDADAGSVHEATRARLAQTEEEMARTAELRERLRRVLDSDEPTPDDLITTMEAMSMNVRLSRIYTRQVDGGETRRADFRTVAKDDLAVEAGGEVDELGAQIGFALSLPDAPAGQVEWMWRIQHDLFDLGAELSTGPSRADDAPRVDSTYVCWLEGLCDELNADLPALDSFLLSGGGTYAAQLQICRAVCRRAERRVVAAAEASVEILTYLNRLSDVLFILVRSAVAGDEVLWEPWSRR